jgi:hypothetical protein
MSKEFAMTPTGNEPPYEIARGEDPGAFYGAGSTAVFVDSAADYGDGDHFDGDDELDSEFAPQPRRRLGKLTAGFLGGLQVQKHEGTTASSAASAFGRRGTGTGTGSTGTVGFGGGGFTGRGTGGTGGTGTTGGTGGAGGSDSGGTGSSGSTTSSIPAVIGQIVSVSGDTVVVKNLGGKMITVKLSGTTTITQVVTPTDLKPGQNVTVSGTTAADGTVDATNVGTR